GRSNPAGTSASSYRPPGSSTGPSPSPGRIHARSWCNDRTPHTSSHTTAQGMTSRRQVAVASGSAAAGGGGRAPGARSGLGGLVGGGQPGQPPVQFLAVRRVGAGTGAGDRGGGRGAEQYLFDVARLGRGQRVRGQQPVEGQAVEQAGGERVARADGVHQVGRHRGVLVPLATELS